MKVLTKSNASACAMALFFCSMMFAMPAFADGITGNAGKILEQVKTGLVTLGVVVITIAIIFAGYQIAFMHKRFTDVAPIVIGAVLIGAASSIAGVLMGSGG